MVESPIPRIWLKAFWGFEPEKDGYVGFTRVASQSRFLSMARPGDLVMIYGTDTAETEQNDRRQVLGFLEIDPVPIKDTDRMSPERAREKASLGWAARWTHAVPVKRAWRCLRRIEVKDVATETLTPQRARVVASMGALLTDDEAKVAFSLMTKPCSVYGQPPVDDLVSQDIVLGKVFKPSRGITPTFGKRDSTYTDGEHFLYILLADGDIAALLGRPEQELRQKCLIKIGFSNDPNRRCAEHNATIPPNSVFKWKPYFRSAPYDDGESAKAAEDLLKSLLDKRLESLGGEFFLGGLSDALSVFRTVPGVAAVTIKSPARRRRNDRL